MSFIAADGFACGLDCVLTLSVFLDAAAEHVVVYAGRTCAPYCAPACLHLVAVSALSHRNSWLVMSSVAFGLSCLD